MDSNIDKLKRKLSYIVPPWWCSPSIIILSSKERATQQYDQSMASKTPLQLVAYTDGSGINNKIGSYCIIPKKSKVIKKFLGARARCTVYMGELQGMKDSLSCSLGQNQSLDIQIFTDNQAALQALQNPNKCSALQIMQTITQYIDDLRGRGIPIHLQWIPAHKNIRGNEEADIAAKEATGWRSAKRKNGKWREWDSRHTVRKHKVGRAKATIKLASVQKTFERWEKVNSREKTGRELYAICPKPTKQTLKIHKSLCKTSSALVVQMETEKIGLQKFLHSRKVAGFDSSECPCKRRVQSAKHLLVEY